MTICQKRRTIQKTSVLIYSQSVKIGLNLEKKYSGAWKICVENKWENEVCPLPCKPKYPTWEELCEIVKKYRSRNELYLKNYRIYMYIKKKYNLDMFENLKVKTDNKSFVHCVYVYEFKGTNHAYVGRTDNITLRHWQHKNNTKDTVRRFAEDNNITLDKPIILADKVNLSSSVKLEEHYFNQYKDNGWIMINKAKTGSIGGLAHKWTYSTCKKEAEKYTLLKDFIKQSVSAYDKAIKYGWLKDYVWLKRGRQHTNIRTLEECKEIASKYTCQKDFRKNDSKIYHYCKSKGWLKEIKWEIPTIKHLLPVIEFSTNDEFIAYHENIRKEKGKKADLIQSKCKLNTNHYAYGRHWYFAENCIKVGNKYFICQCKPK